MAEVDKLEQIAAKAMQENPRLNYPWKIRDLRDPYNPYRQPGYFSEFYHPKEDSNPHPGYPTIDVYKDSSNMQDALIGEMLHYLPYVDPPYENLRQKFRDSITPDQKSIDVKAYGRGGYENEGTFRDWMDRSRLDAYIRAGLSPENNPDWRGFQTSEQIDIINAIRELLKIGTSGKEKIK